MAKHRAVRLAAIAAIDLTCAWSVFWMYDWRGAAALLGGLWFARLAEKLCS